MPETMKSKLNFLDPSVLDPVLFTELTKIREALLAGLGYLKQRCVPVSTIIEEKLGLPLVAGYHYGPYLEDPIEVEHCWNKTPDGRIYIDLTHQQFNRNAPKIAIIESNGQKILKPDLRARRVMPVDTYQLPEQTRKIIEAHLTQF
jgi:hypothetical protein